MIRGNNQSLITCKRWVWSENPSLANSPRVKNSSTLSVSRAMTSRWSEHGRHLGDRLNEFWSGLLEWRSSGGKLPLAMLLTLTEKFSVKTVHPKVKSLITLERSAWLTSTGYEKENASSQRWHGTVDWLYWLALLTAQLTTLFTAIRKRSI